MKHNNVLITGGGGFVGSHLAEHYLKLGANVTILDNFSRTSYNKEFLEKNYPRTKIINADIRNLGEIKEYFNDKDLVLHTAGQVAVTTSIENPKLDFDINTVGTFNVSEASRLSNTNPAIITCSTNKVYGKLEMPVLKKDKRYVYENLLGISEENPIGPDTVDSPYSHSKITSEHILKTYFHTYGLPTVSARMSCIYGTRQFGTEDQGWVAWFAIRALQNKPITIYGDGHQVRDVLFVKDHARAFQALADNIEKTKGQAYNLGGGPENTLSLLELLDILREIGGAAPQISFSDWRMGDQKVYISDISKIRQHTEWHPRVSAREGVELMYSWIKENLHLLG